MNNCPVCGHEIEPHDFRYDEIEQTLVKSGQFIVFKGPTQAAFFNILFKRMPKVVRYESAIMDVWPYDNEPEGARNVLDVERVNLNKKLAPLGLTIRTTWGIGYRLVAQ